jgi:hypothetical protein
MICCPFLEDGKAVRGVGLVVLGKVVVSCISCMIWRPCFRGWWGGDVRRVGWVVW